MNIVNQDIGFGDPTFADGHYFRMRAFHANALVAILAEDHWLAMFEIEHLVRSHAALGKIIERAVVEDVAVLIDLEERNAFVLRGSFDHRAEMLHVDVDRTADESSLAGDCQR